MGGAVPFAAEKTREVFWDFQPALEVLWYVLAGFSVLVFAYGVARPIAKVPALHGGGCPAFELPAGSARRFGSAESHVHRRRDPYAGWAHRGIFYGFVVLFIGTVILAIKPTSPSGLGWRFFDGDFYSDTRSCWDVLGWPCWPAS